MNPLRSPINRSPAPEEEEEEEDYLSTGVTHRKDKDLASGMLVEFDPDRISGNPLAFDGFFVDANIFQVPDRGDEAFEDYFFHVEAFLTTRFEAACQRAEIESSSDSTVGSLPCKKYVCRLLDEEDSVVGIVELYYAVITNSQTKYVVLLVKKKTNQLLFQPFFVSPFPSFLLEFSHCIRIKLVFCSNMDV